MTRLERVAPEVVYEGGDYIWGKVTVGDTIIVSLTGRVSEPCDPLNIKYLSSASFLAFKGYALEEKKYERENCAFLDILNQLFLSYHSSSHHTISS